MVHITYNIGNQDNIYAHGLGYVALGLGHIPYTAKLSRGKTFAVVHKTHHSLENFRGASGPCHYILYTANDSRGKLSRLAKKPRKPRKFSPSKVLPYTVYQANPSCPCYSLYLCVNLSSVHIYVVYYHVG